MGPIVSGFGIHNSCNLMNGSRVNDSHFTCLTVIGLARDPSCAAKCNNDAASLSKPACGQFRGGRLA